MGTIGSNAASMHDSLIEPIGKKDNATIPSREKAEKEILESEGLN
jgi:hypothetical protein